MSGSDYREGSLEAPTRHPLDWKDPDFYNEEAVLKELEPTMEVDGVDKKDYWKVVDHCYLCDLCYMTKCPYVPPHAWNVDFPHLMLRAKAIKHKTGKNRLRDRILTSTDTVGSLAGIPVVAEVVNAVNKNKLARQAMDKVMGVHPKAVVPEYHSNSLRKRAARRKPPELEAEAAGQTKGKVALFATCYCNRNAPAIGEDLIAVFEHNKIPVRLADKEVCCGMPKLELGDLETVEHHKDVNVPQLARLVDEGWDLIAPVPSCVLMFKQELPLMFPEDRDVLKVRDAFYDPFEYLILRHKENKLNTDFKNPLGKIAYHVPCHQRVQNIGLKTRDVLSLIPDTTIEVIERCSGHDGTYAVKSECHDISVKICRPVVNKVKQGQVDHYISDCPMAGDQIQSGMGDESRAESPFTLLRRAYGL